MDWGKAKNVFIIAFLILNISIGYQLYLKLNDGNLNRTQWSATNMEELKDLLAQRDITVKETMPKEAPEMHFLNAKSKMQSNYVEIEKEIEVLSVESMTNLLGENVYKFDDYQYAELESEVERYFRYYQTKNGFPFFGARLDIYLSDTNYLSIKQNYYEVLSKGLDRQVIPSYAAVRTVLDQGLIPDGAEVYAILLGYHGQTNQTSTQLLTPVWRISYRLDGEEKEEKDLFVNAMTGGVQNIQGY